MIDQDEDLAALSRDELVERARALQTVVRVGRAIASATGVADLGARFAEAVASFTRFPAVVVLRYSSTREEFDMVAQRGFDESKFPPTRPLPLRGSLTGLAAERRELVTTEDIEHDDRVPPDTRAALAANQYVSGACMPVIHGGELLGSLNLVYPMGTRLERSERSMLSVLAASFGVALAQQLSLERERELERQARRAQQLESLGVLAGGIAHDFNNLLTGISGSVDLARLEAEERGHLEVVELLDGAIAASSRAASLVRQLLTFSRGGAPVRRAVSDLGALIREVASFAVRGSSVRCEVHVEEPLGVVQVDAGQIAQVVQNLVLNAVQASPSGGTVVVRAWRERGEASGAARVVVEVVDRGTGIAAEHLARIFDPFFTARQGGTGLGLAVTHSVVRRHGGAIRVTSELGKGSTFTFELPASADGAAEREPDRAPVERFHGRMLVMDDDEQVRRVAQAMLSRLGFEVTLVADGEAAVVLAAEATRDGRPFRAALLDVTIVGGVGAREIAAELRRVSPGIRLVISSGYATDGGAEEWDALLPKPYSSERVAEAMERALRDAR